jgi:hypothetical protein
MKMRLRALLAVGLCLTATLTAYPSLAEDAGIDFWNVSDLQTRMSTQDSQSRSLDRESEVTLHRTMIRAEIAGDVAEGRTTFEQAACRYSEVNRSCAKALKFTRKTYEGKSDEERAGWQLIAHLRVHPHPNAGAAANAGLQWMRERY